jgi:hypothetical protein
VPARRSHLVPIVFAPFFGLSIGAALAWAAKADLARTEGPVILTRPFTLVTAFAACVWLPLVAYFALFHRDWSYLYLVPKHPSAIDLGLVLVSGACVIGGFLVVVGPVRKRRVGPVAAVAFTPVGLVAAALPLALRRLAVSGTYAQFHGDFATEPIGSSVLGKGVVLMAAVLAAGLLWTVMWLRRVGSSPP